MYHTPLMPTGAFNICCPRDCVSRHNGGTSGAPLKPLRVDSALRALSTLRGLRGAPEVPPLCRETQSLGQQMLNAPVSINGLSTVKLASKPEKKQKEKPVGCTGEGKKWKGTKTKSTVGQQSYSDNQQMNKVHIYVTYTLHISGEHFFVKKYRLYFEFY